MPKEKTVLGVSQLLPALDLDHLPVALATELSTAAGADALAAAEGGPVTASAAMKIAAYIRLAADFERAISNMFVERTALAAAVADASKILEARLAEMSTAAAARDEMTSKIDELEQRRTLQEEEDRREVDAAQAEVERAINSGDDAQLQSAAERLQGAKQRQAANIDGYSTTQIVLAGYREHASRREAALATACAAVDQARADLSHAEFELSALYWDETSARSLAAFLQIRAKAPQAGSTIGSNRLYGAGDQAFWVSLPHRAVRWNNFLAIGDWKSGPVMIGGRHLDALVSIVADARAAAASLKV